MKAKSLLFFAVMTISGLPLRAQSGAVFAPFVSGLTGEIKNNLVRLSWTDSKDARGPVYLYRSGVPFEMTNLPGQNPGEPGKSLATVPYGTESYVDEIESPGILYYFAVASDETGKNYTIPIEFINTVRVEAGDSAALVPALPAAPGETAPGGISAIEASVRENRVLVSFSGGGAKSLTLYRSTRPIVQTQDLLSAVIIQTNTSSPFTDNPVPGIPYYYAVISEEDLIRGTVKIIPGINATRTPAGTPADSGDMGLRPIPLPRINTAGADGTAGISPVPELSPDAAKTLDNVPPRPKTESSLKKPRVFARDLNVAPSGGEDYTLSSIIKGAFTAKDWETARNELGDFLALPRNPEITARAKFYLGQCCYFLNLSREGLFEFLAVQDRYPEEAGEWIQAVLAGMKK